LIVELGIHRSLAGRVIRSLLQHDTPGFVRELPAARGLAIIADAAARTGADPARVADLREATSRWRAFVDARPGKRRTVSLELAARSSDQRERIDAGLRRAMFQSASEFLGYRVRHNASSLWILPPTRDPIRFDTAHVLSKFGFERLRRDAGPVTIASVRAGVEGRICEFYPIRADASGTCPTDSLLAPFCAGSARIDLVRSPSHAVEFRLPEDQPAVGQPIDLVWGQRAPAMLRAVGSDEWTHEYYEVLPRIPSASVTIDIFVHVKAYPFAVPPVSGRVFAPGVPRCPAGDTPIGDTVRVPGAVEFVSRGMIDADVGDAPGYRDMVHWTTEQLGFSPDAFRMYRFSMAHPMLLAGLCFWFPLSPPQRG
jgi:hypothetical protein